MSRPHDSSASPQAPSLASFLADATSLTPRRAVELYRAGSPWPLFTADDIKQAAILAQAEGLLLDEALADVHHASCDAGHDECLAQLAEAQRMQGPAYLEAKKQALAGLPTCEIAIEHMLSVITLTKEKPNTIFRLFIALQRYALTHPS